ncbi:helix-turn-helix domain-containing protein [Caulobacter sp. RL271]|uniref:Helix-turn-helix transcriptional regulator n=1 Tax=Caulobacter segnis TaxID=88688 RepID=A0ABY4ZR86_9CAUL|nr:helix-turn-helix transcriptional regulator [Caulobacter segnis]USQ95302.1 helix-turn-helix transcriptional regulator [Caulobacter segnis]
MSRFDKLTPREHDVLLGAAQLKSSKEIAFDLSLRKATVDKHIASAVGKLQTGSRRQAAMMLVVHLREAGLPILYQGRPIPLPFEPSPSANSMAKGDLHVRTDGNGASLSGDQLERPRSDLRRPGDHAGGAGGGAALAENHPALELPPVSARSDARDYLHRFRSDARERSFAQRPRFAPQGRSKAERLILILAAALASVVLALVVLALVIQVGHLSDAYDAWLRRR